MIYCEVTLQIVTFRSSWIRYELLNMRMNRWISSTLPKELIFRCFECIFQLWNVEYFKYWPHNTNDQIIRCCKHRKHSPCWLQIYVFSGNMAQTPFDVSPNFAAELLTQNQRRFITPIWIQWQRGTIPIAGISASQNGFPRSRHSSASPSSETGQ